MSALYHTYLNLIPLASLHATTTEDLSEIAVQYQTTYMTDRTLVFSYVFCATYPLIRATVSKYYGITEYDVVSFVMEELHNSLMHYSLDRNTKFTTLLRTYINRRLFKETSDQKHHKRKLNALSESLEALQELMDVGKDDSGLLEVDLMLSVEQGLLSKNELEYCKRILTTACKVSDTEIAESLNISPSAVHYIKKRLEKKINFILG